MTFMTYMVKMERLYQEQDHLALHSPMEEEEAKSISILTFSKRIQSPRLNQRHQMIQVHLNQPHPLLRQHPEDRQLPNPLALAVGAVDEVPCEYQEMKVLHKA